MTSFLEVLWQLLVAHVLADFVLQSDSMAVYKRPDTVTTRNVGPWWIWMAAHGIVNGAAVAWVLQTWWIGPLEALWHGVTDYLKVTRRIGFWGDQASHLLAKVVWVFLVQRCVTCTFL